MNSRKSLLHIVTLLTILGAAWPLDSEAQREDWFRPFGDPDAIRQALGEEKVSGRWKYEDMDAARMEAQATGKPILALFRCVPCGSAAGLDGAVCTVGGAQATEFEAAIREAGGGLDALLDQFVAVRMVMMNGVNRNVFQQDRDVPYAVMFLNADGTVYGRYGTRVSQDRKVLPRHNLSSFQQALHRALALHKGYPANKVELAGKLGGDRMPPMAEDMETFEPFLHNPQGVQNCIHCHTVGEAELRDTVAKGALAQRDLFPFPLPEYIGINTDIEDGLKVDSVGSGSPAQGAGIQSGDILVSLAGQPLVSESDIQWVLHNAPDAGSLPAIVQRNDKQVETELTLAGGWRKYDSSWRGTLHVLRPGFRLSPEPEKGAEAAASGQMGLTVFWPRPEAKAAGIQAGDIVVAVDGHTGMKFEGDVLSYIHIEHPEKKSIALSILREGKKLEVTLPIPR